MSSAPASAPIGHFSRTHGAKCFVPSTAEECSCQRRPGARLTRSERTREHHGVGQPINIGHKESQWALISLAVTVQGRKSSNTNPIIEDVALVEGEAFLAE